jgi:predicted Zn-dependent protease with MMP-like domain
MAVQELIDRAWKAYRQAKPRQGAEHARAALSGDADDGEAWYALACNLERAGRLMEADRAFVRADRAPKRGVGIPYRVSWSRFQRSVKAAAEALPPQLKAALGEVTLVLADYAEPYLIEDYEDPELMGMLEGSPRSERSGYGGLVSPRIHIWRRTHEHTAGTAKEFDAEIRQTLHHELGHYLGWEEGDLEGMGMG